MQCTARDRQEIKSWQSVHESLQSKYYNSHSIAYSCNSVGYLFEKKIDIVDKILTLFRTDLQKKKPMNEPW